MGMKPLNDEVLEKPQSLWCSQVELFVVGWTLRRIGKRFTVRCSAVEFNIYLGIEVYRSIVAYGCAKRNTLVTLDTWG